MEENYRFHNLVVGILTRSSLKEAFKKGITAQQIMGFLQKHAHPQTLKSNNSLNQAMDQKTNENSIGTKFGLARDRGLENVS